VAQVGALGVLHVGAAREGLLLDVGARVGEDLGSGQGAEEGVGEVHLVGS